MKNFDEIISTQHYSDFRGEHCPHCGGTDLDRAPSSRPKGGIVTAWVGCEKCRFTWQEVYQLSGYRELLSPLQDS